MAENGATAHLPGLNRQLEPTLTVIPNASRCSPSKRSDSDCGNPKANGNGLATEVARSGDLVETMMKGEPVQSMAGCDEAIGDLDGLKNLRVRGKIASALEVCEAWRNGNNAATRVVPGEFIGHR